MIKFQTHDGLIRYIARKIRDGNVEYVNKKRFKEAKNVIFSIGNHMEPEGYERYMLAVEIERKYFLRKARLAAKMITKDAGCRRACFAYIENWFKMYGHCIAMMHFYLRNERASVNVYVRSWDFDKFFQYDIDSIVLARDEFYNTLKNRDLWDDILKGDIIVHAFSVHKEESLTKMRKKKQ